MASPRADTPRPQPRGSHPAPHCGFALLVTLQACHTAVHGQPNGTGTYAVHGCSGYCSDYVYLPEGAYPARLSRFSGDALYAANPITECMNRCIDASAYDPSIGALAFYVKERGQLCGCSSGQCSSLTMSSSYQSYVVVPAENSSARVAPIGCDPGGGNGTSVDEKANGFATTSVVTVIVVSVVICGVITCILAIAKGAANGQAQRRQAPAASLQFFAQPAATAAPNQTSPPPPVWKPTKPTAQPPASASATPPSYTQYTAASASTAAAGGTDEMFNADGTFK